MLESPQKEMYAKERFTALQAQRLAQEIAFGPIVFQVSRLMVKFGIFQMLDVDYDIACRIGLHCAPKVHEGLGTINCHGSVRFSVGAFTTEQEIDTAIEAVKDIASMKN